jgi:hypothetical protein
LAPRLKCGTPTLLPGRGAIKSRASSSNVTLEDSYQLIKLGGILSGSDTFSKKIMRFHGIYDSLLFSQKEAGEHYFEPAESRPLDMVQWVTCRYRKELHINGENYHGELDNSQFLKIVTAPMISSFS